jgi:hypothetical protein
VNKGSTTKGIFMKINLIFKLVVLVFSVCLNTSDVFAREVEYWGEEILIYIVPDTLTKVTFLPDRVAYLLIQVSEFA